MPTREAAAVAGAFDEAMAAVDGTLRAIKAAPEAEEVGTIEYIGRTIARVRGLEGAEANELLSFPGGVYGTAFNLDPGSVGVMLLSGGEKLEAGDEANRTGRLVDVPVGEGLLGRIVDPLGLPLDGGGPVRTAERRRIEQPAPSIMDRLPVEAPLQTGIKVIDAMIPVGRGQRELILGDRQTGKTAIALDAIINQRETGVLCVYCAIGKQSSAVAKLAADLRARGADAYTILVVASGEDAPGLQFIAPYAATSMAEYFMLRGRDVLIVYDDLLQHAQAYREVSLLFRRPPAREAYPGDIFYIHSRLLERATRLTAEKGGGSLTALPIVETQAQNIAAYIPTNLISITDGQIYLSPDLFSKGVLPAVDVGKSVSRVGGQAQLPAYRAVSSALRLSYSQFEELETFSRFGTRLDEKTRLTIEHGRRVREALKQPRYQPLSVAEQTAVLLAATAELFDELPLEAVGAAELRVREAVTRSLPDLCRDIESGRKLDERGRGRILSVARAAVGEG